MAKALSAIAGTSFLLLLSQSEAAPLGTEPPEGRLRAGQRVLVNDGSCPRGQIKEVTGGSNRVFGTRTSKPGTSRLRRCIPK